MSCKKANSHGAYVLSTYSEQEYDGYDDGEHSTLEHWWTMTFDITTQHIFNSCHDECSSKLIKTFDNTYSHQGYIHDHCFWNDNFLLLFSPKDGLDASNGAVIQALFPIDNMTFPEFGISKAITLHEDCITSTGARIYMDDDFIILRTDSGMAVFSPGEPKRVADRLVCRSARDWVDLLKTYHDQHGTQIQRPSEACNLPYLDDSLGASTVYLYD